MSSNFLDLPERGNTEVWRFLLGLFVVFFAWFILGSLPAIALLGWVAADDDPTTTVDLSSGLAAGVSPLLNFFVLMTSFWFLILGLFFAVRVLHRRRFGTLITPYRRIDWRRVGVGFSVYLGIVAVVSLLEFALTPDIYILTLDWPAFLPFLLLMILLIPIQTTAEELFFRGYLLQMLGRGVRNVWVLSFVNGALFMLPHLANPEVASDPVLLPLYYLGIGTFLALITLKDNGMELALGAHAANNLFAGIFANYTDSVLQTESIFTVLELNAPFALVGLAVTAVVFYLIVRPGGKAQPIEEHVEATL